MGRLSDAVGPRIQAGVDALDIPQVVKDSIEWELAPALVPSGRPGEFGFTYMLALSLPVPGSVDDYVMHCHPMEDPHASQDDVSGQVRRLYASVQAEADDRRVKQTAPLNGSRYSEGGLAIP